MLRPRLASLAVLAAVAIASPSVSAQQSTPAVDPVQKEAIEQVVRDYIRPQLQLSKNPAL